MSLKVLILGVNGFIGNHLARTILEKTDWQVSGLDIAKDNLNDIIDHERFNFLCADIFTSNDWITEQLHHCDVLLPLVAIANPAIYVSDPLKVFELDFEANLSIIKQCIHTKTRVIFPSTSEVYGMASDTVFDEELTNLVTGPINKERWIYSSSKQLLDRVIYAYGHHRGLEYTLFRPFNWIGPRLDQVFQKKNTSRVVSKFLSNIIYGEEIQLVDGGQQSRTFTYIDDAIEALLFIIENKNQCAKNEIFNIGNPTNHMTIRELAETLVTLVKQYPKYRDNAEKTKIIDISGQQLFGQGYQDVSFRVPSIKRAQEKLNWQPRTDMKTSLTKTVDFYLSD